MTFPAQDVALWDAEAEGFDNDPDHGLRDPSARSAWEALLESAVPSAPTVVADLGCGTGSIAVLLAKAGHHVVGVDSSLKMLEKAKLKSENLDLSVAYQLGDVSQPDLEPHSFDVVLCRHVLWAFDDPGPVLDKWIELLNEGGRLVLIEGRWSTGAGITAFDLESLLATRLTRFQTTMLNDSALWGREIEDERYLVVATL